MVQDTNYLSHWCNLVLQGTLKTQSGRNQIFIKVLLLSHDKSYRYFSNTIEERSNRMNQQFFPARLHLLIPRNSDNGIVIRRAPSKQVCILNWDRNSNKFTVSQWLKGRIYERRSDISPSGKYWIYFAMNGKWQSQVKGSWTAIAKVPWLKAIELLSKGDCWHGGGLFLDDKNYWLNDGYGHESLFNSNEVNRNKLYQLQNYYGGECLNIY